MISITDFISRECKEGIHLCCHGSWEGLQIHVNCSCSCHSRTSECKQRSSNVSLGEETSNLRSMQDKTASNFGD